MYSTQFKHMYIANILIHSCHMFRPDKRWSIYRQVECISAGDTLWYRP